jgi:hypothetical protein
VRPYVLIEKHNLGCCFLFFFLKINLAYIEVCYFKMSIVNPSCRGATGYLDLHARVVMTCGSNNSYNLRTVTCPNGRPRLAIAGSGMKIEGGFQTYTRLRACLVWRLRRRDVPKLWRPIRPSHLRRGKYGAVWRRRRQTKHALIILPVSYFKIQTHTKRKRQVPFPHTKVVV